MCGKATLEPTGGFRGLLSRNTNRIWVRVGRCLCRSTSGTQFTKECVWLCWNDSSIHGRGMMYIQWKSFAIAWRFPATKGTLDHTYTLRLELTLLWKDFHRHVLIEMYSYMTALLHRRKWWCPGKPAFNRKFTCSKLICKVLLWSETPMLGRYSFCNVSTWKLVISWNIFPN